MLVVRQSSNIKADRRRNYSVNWATALDAESRADYIRQASRRLGCDPSQIAGDVVRVGQGRYALRHHQWLSCTPLVRGNYLKDAASCQVVTEEEFANLPDDEKAALANTSSWTYINDATGAIECDQPFFAFDGRKARLVWSDGSIHVLSVDPVSGMTNQRASGIHLLDAFD